MKKFKFTLSRMLDYKDQLLDEEKNKLALLRQKKQEIDDHIESLLRELDKLSETMLQEQERGITAFQLLSYESQRTNIRRQIEQLKKEQALAKLEVKRQVQVVVQATQEVSKLDKLQDKQLEEYKKMVMKAEELEIEEFVSSRRIVTQSQAQE
ncbi:hypothetical protein D3Z39_00955 [Anaerotruncus colihominis]|jgi:flagellar FliJ protein|uniref:Flagellar FliJ protein n=1 Tax=Anaerotruncus colihominis TaxID=169435 RepID=A0A845RB87_9FIRM|nr:MULTISPECIES: flagellar FliJ family protein [Anaerotruncus]MCI8492904.1 hypothetical protein [Anaerotruncus sp.]NBI77456.1 hypothetical protein [Anaerotruncus colihominis]